jgi:hypothetical protein
MPFLINIGVMKTNGLTTNGNLDIGAAVHNSNMSNTKSVGTSQVFGDLSPSLCFKTNGFLDVSLFEQDQILSPTAPITNQI